MSFCRAAPGGASLTVRVVPRAKKTEIAGTRAGALLVRVVAPPVDDAANDEVIDLLARRLGVPRRALTIVSGRHARLKLIVVAGQTPAAIESALGHN